LFVAWGKKKKKISFIIVKQLFVRCLGKKEKEDFFHHCKTTVCSLLGEKKKKKSIFAERLHSLAVSCFIRCCFSTFFEVCSVNRSFVNAVKGNLSVDLW